MAINNVLMIGCGKMGGALLGNWLRSGDNFTVIDPALDNPIPGAALVRDIGELSGRQFDTVIIAIKPQMIDSVLPDYVPMLAPGGYALSIAAGCSIDRIQRQFNAAPVVRVMPNLPAAIGKGVSAICASRDATQDHLAHACTIMELTGAAIKLDDEDQIDRFTALIGSGPGYIFEFARAYVETAIHMGFDEASSRVMVLGMIEGTIAMARNSTQPLESLRSSVTSKGGTTAAGLGALNGDGDLSALLEATVKAAYDRALELK